MRAAHIRAGPRVVPFGQFLGVVGMEGRKRFIQKTSSRRVGESLKESTSFYKLVQLPLTEEKKKGVFLGKGAESESAGQKKAGLDGGQ